MCLSYFKPAVTLCISLFPLPSPVKRAHAPATVKDLHAGIFISVANFYLLVAGEFYTSFWNDIKIIFCMLCSCYLKWWRVVEKKMADTEGLPSPEGEKSFFHASHKDAEAEYQHTRSQKGAEIYHLKPPPLSATSGQNWTVKKTPQTHCVWTNCVLQFVSFTLQKYHILEIFIYFRTHKQTRKGKNKRWATNFRCKVPQRRPESNRRQKMWEGNHKHYLAASFSSNRRRPTPLPPQKVCLVQKKEPINWSYLPCQADLL